MVFREYGYPTETLKTGIESLENVNIDLSDSNTLLQCLGTLLQCLGTTTKQTGRPVAIFFDQFERFFVNLPENRRQQFIQEFSECFKKFNSQEMNIFISIREEFYFDTLQEFWQVIPEFNTVTYCHKLKPLNEEQARDAIKKPIHSIAAKNYLPTKFYR